MDDEEKFEQVNIIASKMTSGGKAQMDMSIATPFRQ
jgi:hypothetical protein